MQLSDVEKLLGITVVGTDQEATYQTRLDDAIDFVKEYCRNDFKDANGNEVIPKGAQMGVALLVKAMGDNPGVSYKLLVGVGSTTFFEGATGREAKRYLKPYVRLFV